MDPTKMFQHSFRMAADTPAPAPAPAPSPAPAEPAEKKYSDKELNDIIKGKQTEQVDKLLKDLGIESTGSLKDRIAALKKYEDEHKTELDKEKEGRTAAEKARAEAEARANKAEAKAEALALGVPKDKVDDFITLAMGEEGATMAAKVAAALEKRPYFKEAAAPEAPNLGQRIKTQTTPEVDAAKAAFNAALGIRS
jgi:uncharacterized small protein (DUF1192 family)